MNPRSLPPEGEELRALELLAQIFAQTAPKYQFSAKPNKAQIAETMSQQAVDAYGMSKSKLHRSLREALEAWEEMRS